MKGKKPALIIWFLMILAVYLPFHYGVWKMYGDFFLLLYTTAIGIFPISFFFKLRVPRGELILYRTGKVLTLIFIKTVAYFATALMLESKVLGGMFFIVGAMWGFDIVRIVSGLKNGWLTLAWGENIFDLDGDKAG